MTHGFEFESRATLLIKHMSLLDAYGQHLKSQKGANSRTLRQANKALDRKNKPKVKKVRH